MVTIHIHTVEGMAGSAAWKWATLRLSDALRITATAAADKVGDFAPYGSAALSDDECKWVEENLRPATTSEDLWIHTMAKAAEPSTKTDSSVSKHDLLNPKSVGGSRERIGGGTQQPPAKRSVSPGRSRSRGRRPQQHPPEKPLSSTSDAVNDGNWHKVEARSRSKSRSRGKQGGGKS